MRQAFVTPVQEAEQGRLYAALCQFALAHEDARNRLNIDQPDMPTITLFMITYSAAVAQRSLSFQDQRS